MPEPDGSDAGAVNDPLIVTVNVLPTYDETVTVMPSSTMVSPPPSCTRTRESSIQPAANRLKASVLLAGTDARRPPR